MHFNLLDLIIVAATAVGAIRGRQRGLPRELPRLLGITVAALTGAGLFSWTGRVLSTAQLFTRQSLGLTGGLAIVIASFVIVRHFKRQIHDWTARRFPEPRVQRRAGGVAGGLRALMLGCFVVVFLGLLPGNPLKPIFAGGSIFGRTLIRFVVPVYDTVTGQRAPAP